MKLGDDVTSNDIVNLYNGGGLQKRCSQILNTLRTGFPFGNVIDILHICNMNICRCAPGVVT